MRLDKCDEIPSPRWPARASALVQRILRVRQWFNETAEQFPFLQLVWPDNQSRYPWQPECSLRPGTQLLLGPSGGPMSFRGCTG